MAAGEFGIRIPVTAESEGEDAYNTHAQGVRQVTQATEESTAAQDRNSEATGKGVSRLLVLQGAILGVIGGLRRLNILTDDQSALLLQVMGGLQAVAGLYRLVGSGALAAARAIWTKIAAHVAEAGVTTAGLAVPILLGIIGGALAGVAVATATQGLALGTPAVTRAGAFTVGERGEETVYLPRGAAVVPNGGMGGARSYTVNLIGDARQWQAELREVLEF